MGSRIWLGTIVVGIAAIVGMLVFASINIWISAAIFLLLLVASFPLNAVIISRTEKN